MGCRVKGERKQRGSSRAGLAVSATSAHLRPGHLVFLVEGLRRCEGLVTGRPSASVRGPDSGCCVRATGTFSETGWIPSCHLATGAATCPSGPGSRRTWRGWGVSGCKVLGFPRMRFHGCCYTSTRTQPSAAGGCSWRVPEVSRLKAGIPMSSGGCGGSAPLPLVLKGVLRLRAPATPFLSLRSSCLPV